MNQCSTKEKKVSLKTVNFVKKNKILKLLIQGY